MRYSRMTTPPPRKKRKLANFIIVVIILGIAAYLISAGAAGSWIAENIIDPVFNNGVSNAATPTPTGTAPLSSPEATISSLNLPESSGVRTEQKISAEEILLFTLQTGAFSEEGNASAAATQLKAAGGAGFVFSDGELYRVLIAGYLDSNDAEEVKTSLEGQNVAAKVYNIKSGSLSFNIEAEQSQIDAIKACFDVVPDTAQTLQQIIFDADQGVNVDQNLTGLKQSVNTVLDHFNTAVSSNTDILQNLRTYMQSFCDKIDSLPSSSSATAAEFSSSLKYALIEIVSDYSAFLNGLNG